MIKSKRCSCRGCLLEHDGNCTWFAKPKNIPTDIYTKGCKHRVSRTESIEHDPIVERIVDLFHGELL